MSRERSSEMRVPESLWNDPNVPAPKLLDILNPVSHLLNQLGYSKSASALQKEASKNGVRIDTAAWEADDNKVALLELYRGSANAIQRGNKDDSEADSESESSKSESDESESESESESERDPVEGNLVDVEAEETSDDGSSEESERGAVQSTTKAGQKRKRTPTPSSGSESSSDSDDSDSESSDSSSDDASARPPTKKTKVEDDSSSASDTHSDSDSSSDSGKDSSGNSDVSSDSDSSSSSGSSSVSESSSDDDSDASSTSSSSSSAAPAPKKSKKANTKAAKAAKPTKSKPSKSADAQERLSSTSSTTLDGEPIADSSAPANAAPGGSAGPEDEVLVVNTADAAGAMHPDRLRRLPATKANIASLQKQHVPFSRIPADQKVDPRFASNEYVPYDYANRAHQDLIVTKGKGFTKEKNKKKRGAYRGGTIDLTPKGIKFED